MDLHYNQFKYDTYEEKGVYMGLLDIFKKKSPQRNNSSITYSVPTNGYVHAYGISLNDPTIFVEYENGYIVSQLRFHVNQGEVKICDFLAGGKDKSFHHGTELFLAFLKHYGKPITRIYGELSAVDALNKNWNRSITFYADLPKYIFSNLGLKYDFHLFDDDFYRNDVTHILTDGNREENIEKYRQEHLTDADGNPKNRSGSFHYILY